MVGHWNEGEAVTRMTPARKRVVLFKRLNGKRACLLTILAIGLMLAGHRSAVAQFGPRQSADPRPPIPIELDEKKPEYDESVKQPGAAKPPGTTPSARLPAERPDKNGRGSISNGRLGRLGAEASSESDADNRRLIGSLGTNISPPSKDEDGQILELPENAARKLFSKEPPIRHRVGHSRSWSVSAYEWRPTEFCHGPLYFEEINLERYGNEFCFIQPVISSVQFFGTLPLLPYKTAAESPTSCIYDLGHFRPGNLIPYRYHRIGWDFWAAAYQGGVVTGLMFAIP